LHVANLVCVISKGSTLCIIIVNADPVYSLADNIDYRAWPTVAPPLWANQEGLSIRTRCSYTHLGSTLSY